MLDPRCSPGVIGRLAAGRGAAGCAGVQLDDWKLVTSFDDSRNTMTVHDIRALPAAQGARWQEPVLSLSAPARISCFKVKLPVLSLS